MSNGNESNIQELIDFRNSVAGHVYFSVPIDNGDGTASVGSVTLNNGDWIYLYLTNSGNIIHAWNFATCTGTSTDGQYLSEHTTTAASTDWEFPSI